MGLLQVAVLVGCRKAVMTSQKTVAHHSSAVGYYRMEDSDYCNVAEGFAELGYFKTLGQIVYSAEIHSNIVDFRRSMYIRICVMILRSWSERIRLLRYIKLLI
ncbi:hypothetical protein ACFFRR_000040 [Megaselia abdita]